MTTASGWSLLTRFWLYRHYECSTCRLYLGSVCPFLKILSLCPFRRDKKGKKVVPDNKFRGAVLANSNQSGKPPMPLDMPSPRPKLAAPLEVCFPHASALGVSLSVSSKVGSVV
eukprot:6192221-Pleurochrysis_carterae.AAC.4